VYLFFSIFIIPVTGTSLSLLKFPIFRPVHKFTRPRYHKFHLILLEVKILSFIKSCYQLFCSILVSVTLQYIQDTTSATDIKYSNVVKQTLSLCIPQITFTLRLLLQTVLNIRVSGSYNRPNTVKKKILWTCWKSNRNSLVVLPVSLSFLCPAMQVMSLSR